MRKIEAIAVILHALASIAGIIAITILEIKALEAGIDSALLILSFSFIGGLAGANIRKIRDIFRKLFF